jgi:hypothetical protein
LEDLLSHADAPWNGLVYIGLGAITARNGDRPQVVTIARHHERRPDPEELFHSE